MPLTFLNGQDPDYAGYVFTTSIDLMLILESTLNSAGWVTHSKDPSGLSMVMKGITTINSHECFVQFVATATQLTIRGAQSGDLTTVSPSGVHVFNFSDGLINRLWLTADNDAGCICIYGASGACAGAHFGFLQRIDTNDQWAWGIGWIHSQGHLYYYPAKHKHNDADWVVARQYFYYSDANNNQIPPCTYDFTVRPPTSNTSHAWNDGRNWSWLAYNGRRNYDDKAVIDPYSYQEGRGSTTGYGWNPGVNPLYFRGVVKYAYCGVASEQAATQVWDDVSGYRILTVGNGQWQGMRIL